MKIAILIAFLITTTVGEQCEADKMSFEIYSDPKCTKLDKDATKRYGHIDKSREKALHSGCHTGNYDFSWRFMCDSYGFHWTFYKGRKCRRSAGEYLKNDGKFNF